MVMKPEVLPQPCALFFCCCCCFPPRLRERGTQAAVVSSLWCRAPSPSRTRVTPRTGGRSVSIMPIGPTAASRETTEVSMCPKSREDATLTRSAPWKPARSGSDYSQKNIVNHLQVEINRIWFVTSLVSMYTICPQDCVFQDLGEGILENAVQVAITVYFNL